MLRLPMQFLIENAVCHGLPLVVVKVLCVFRACSKQNLLMVEDDGCGMDEKIYIKALV